MYWKIKVEINLKYENLLFLDYFDLSRVHEELLHIEHFTLRKHTIRSKIRWLLNLKIYSNLLQVFCTSMNGNTYGTKFRLSEDKSAGSRITR